MSNLIKLIYSLNGEESSVAYDPLNKIVSLKNLINLTQKINLDDYEVFYRKKEIKWTDETPIKAIIGKENVPIFYIKLKAGKKHEPNDEKSVNDKSHKPQESKDGKPVDKSGKEEKKDGKPQEKDNKNIKEEKKDGKPIDKKVDNKTASKQDVKTEKDKNSNNVSGDHTKDHSFVDNDSKDLTNLKCKVIVDNFPSRPEFYSILEKFVDSKHAHSDCAQKTTATGVEITFKNPDLAYDFLKHVNMEKIKNPLYSKIKTNLVLDVKKVSKVLPKKTSKIATSAENSLDISGISPGLNNDPNSRFFKLNNQVSKSQNFKELAVFEHFNKIKDENLKHKLLKKHYKDAKYVSLASPYMSEEDRYRKEYHVNKKKWVEKKGFFLAAQKKSNIKEIHNFVNLCDFGESPLNHQFREYGAKDKKRWLNQKNFFV